MPPTDPEATPASDEVIERVEAALAGRSKGKWTKFHSRFGDSVVAIMKGRQPPIGENGYYTRKWKEIVAWSGFDSADTTQPQRHRDAEAIVAAVNAAPALIARIRQAEQERDEALRENIATAREAGEWKGRCSTAEERAKALEDGLRLIAGLPPVTSMSAPEIALAGAIGCARHLLEGTDHD